MDVYKLLEKRNKSAYWKSIFTTEEVNFIVEELYKEYLSGMSLVKLAKKYKLGRNELSLKFKRRGYKIINRQNKLRVRENLFESIETEEDAYWLGFIYADGYISDLGKFELSLGYVDYEHLLKFADYCGFNKDKVVKKQKTNFPNCFRSRMGFATQHLKQRFFDLGIIPRKSLILTYPNFIPEHLEKHFIRGYFDGDGCCGLYLTKRNNLKVASFSCLGTKDFLEILITKLPENLKVYYFKDRNLHGLSTSNRKANRLLKFLYEDSTIYLNRKYNRFLTIKKYYNNR